MKILTLKIDNFISIKHAELDFTKFKDGVMLLFGPTGSGKSTILDAVHWALYGTTLNQQRSSIGVSKTIYSDYADGKADVRVELVFSQKGVEYKVIRTLRPKDGSSTIKVYIPDNIIDKVREGNQAIEKIIGLNSKQYDQITMLEQGNFSKFLLADSKDRALLLRNVFDTQIFQMLDQRLKTKVDTLKSEIDNTLQLEQAYLRGESLDTIKSRIELTKQAKTENEQRLEQYQADLQEYQILQPKLHEYNRQMQLYTAAQAELNRLEQQRDYIDRIAVKKALYEQYAETIKLYDKSIAVKQSLDSAEAEIKTLQQQLWDKSCKAVSLDEVDEAKAKYETANTQFSNTYEYEDTLTKRGYLQLDLQKLATQIAETSEQLDVVQKEGDALNALLPEREQYERELTAYNNNINILAQKQASLTQLTERLDSAKPDYVASLKQHLLQMCDDDTCPICGAVYTHDSFTDVPKISFDEYQQLQQEAFVLQSWINDQHTMEAPICPVEQTSQEIRVKLNELTKKRTALSNQLNDYTTKQTLKQHEAEQLATRLSDLSEYKDMDSRTLSIELELAEEAYKALKADYDKYKQAEQVINNIRVKIDSWKQTIALRKSEAEKDGVPLDPTMITEGVEYRDAVLDYERNQTRYVTDTERFNSDVVRLSAITAPDKVADITELECQTKINQLIGDINALIRTIAGTDNTIANDTKTVEDVLAVRAQRAELSPKHKECKYVYDLLSGKNVAKLSLENYVLHRQLEWILDTSNRYLSMLSNNQFALNIRWESMGRTQGGLEISILDRTSGKLRPAQTYSGGELFMLSLSLSLGLMASIGSLFSGISLDMLAIDEGFGTLDPECLSRVMSTLQGMHGISNVILISHVQELIDTIPQGFLVDKGLTGTTIKQFGV